MVERRRTLLTASVKQLPAKDASLHFLSLMTTVLIVHQRSHSCIGALQIHDDDDDDDVLHDQPSTSASVTTHFQVTADRYVFELTAVETLDIFKTLTRLLLSC